MDDLYIIVWNWCIRSRASGAHLACRTGHPTWQVDVPRALASFALD
jgi:hypothetical protein